VEKRAKSAWTFEDVIKFTRDKPSGEGMMIASRIAIVLALAWPSVAHSQGAQNDPAAPVAHPKYQNPPPRILSRMEYRALRDAARSDLRIRAIIELMLQTGVRIGEVANLRLEDISDKIFIRAYESQPQREVPLNETARDALNQYIAIRPKTTSDHIFVTKTGKPLLVRNIRSAIDRYFREAGIEKAKVNDLRNTFIVHQLKSGVDIVTVSKIAGHKRLSTTEHYLQFIDKREGKKGTKLEEL